MEDKNNILSNKLYEKTEVEEQEEYRKN